VKRLSLSLWAVLAVLVMLCVPVGAQDSSTEPLPFFASFVPNVQFSPLYVAREEGYFAQIGFDLQIQHGDENVGVIQIAQGEPRYGLISGEQVLLARNGGVPVQFVYAWFQKYPIAVVARGELGFDEPSDLKGLKVGVPGPFGASYTALVALLGLGGLTDADIQMESIGYVAPDVFCAGGVQASMVYANNEPLEIQRRIDAGQCGDVTSISTYQVSTVAPMVSNGIVVSEATIAERPDEVANVVWAYDAGLRDVIANPAQAYLHSLKYVENLPASEPFVAALEALAEDAEAAFGTPEARAATFEALVDEFGRAETAQFGVLLATIALWEGETLGITTLEQWELTRDVLAEIGSVPADLDVSTAFFNGFVPDAAEQSE
jgi:NitT/TauT family transport system substrate-binding protein